MLEIKVNYPALKEGFSEVMMNMNSSYLARRSGTIAERTAARMTESTQKRVLAIWKTIRGLGLEEDLESAIQRRPNLAALNPIHAPYTYAQNQVSILCEELAALKEMLPLSKVIADAEGRYMPSGPPMSPLTVSYFTFWAFFDACMGPAKETIGTTIGHLGSAFGIHAELERLIRTMQESRMGFYVHRGREGKVAILEDLVAGTVSRAIVPAGYEGKKGELWYARLLPPPFAGGREHVVITTPYIILHPGFEEWLAYFQRTLSATARARHYEHHMKYGPNNQYWNEYVFEAYLHNKKEAIFLVGLPDIARSRPHSRISVENGWNGPAFR